MNYRYFSASVFLFAALVSFSHAAEPAYPNYAGYVNDFANVLDPGTKQQIEAICVSLEAATRSELAVVTVKTTAPLDSKSYAVKLFEKWKIGKKGLDNGLLFLLASDDRRVEIEVSYGLEGIINDAKAGEILDNFVVPSFAKNEFARGMLLGSQAIASEIEKKTVGTSKNDLEIEKYKNKIMSIIYKVVMSVFAAGFFILLFARRSPNITRAGIGAIFGYIFIGGFYGIIIGAVLGFLLGMKGGGGFGSGMGGPFGGGSWSSGGGGGFGGFGGGRSGGGGAGRSF